MFNLHVIPRLKIYNELKSFEIFNKTLNLRVTMCSTIRREINSNYKKYKINFKKKLY